MTSVCFGETDPTKMNRDAIVGSATDAPHVSIIRLTILHNEHSMCDNYISTREEQLQQINITTH